MGTFTVVIRSPPPPAPAPPPPPVPPASRASSGVCRLLSSPASAAVSDATATDGDDGPMIFLPGVHCCRHRPVQQRRRCGGVHEMAVSLFLPSFLCRPLNRWLQLLRLADWLVPAESPAGDWRAWFCRCPVGRKRAGYGRRLQKFPVLVWRGADQLLH